MELGLLLKENMCSFVAFQRLSITTLTLFIDMNLARKPKTKSNRSLENISKVMSHHRPRNQINI